LLVLVWIRFRGSVAILQTLHVRDGTDINEAYGLFFGIQPVKLNLGCKDASFKIRACNVCTLIL
jgi:hypothetical protein